MLFIDMLYFPTAGYSANFGTDCLVNFGSADVYLIKVPKLSAD